MDLCVDPIWDWAQYLQGWQSDNLRAGKPARDPAENVRNLGTQQSQDGDNDDSHQDQDQRVLYQTLAFFSWQIHDFHLPSG